MLLVAKFHNGAQLISRSQEVKQARYSWYVRYKNNDEWDGGFCKSWSEADVGMTRAVDNSPHQVDFSEIVAVEMRNAA